MGSVGSELLQLRKQVSMLKPFLNRTDEVENPLIYNMDKVQEILQEVEKRERKGTLPEPEVKSVFLDRVYTSQPYLEIEKLNDFVDKDIQEFAEGYMYQGDVYITDGNHRIALAKLNNQSTARMSVIDLDKKVKKK